MQNGTVLPGGRDIAAFSLQDQDGRPFGQAQLRGAPSLLFFGFTHCPDVCPTDLQQIGLTMNMLGTAASEVVPIFITLDPKRDTRKLLSAYVPAFHPQIVGLTGSEADIRQVARAYRVYYEKVPVGGWLRYTIDHSSFIYLMGGDGRYLGFLPPGTAANRMLEVIKPLLAAKSR